MYSLVVVIVTLGSFFFQRASGVLYDYEYYRENRPNIIANFGVGEGDSGYDRMILDTIQRESNPTNLISKYTFSHAINLDIFVFFLAFFICTLPLALVKKYQNYKEVFVVALVAVILGIFSGTASSMNWFGDLDPYGGSLIPPLALIAVPFIFALVIEITGVLLYLKFKKGSM